MIFNNQVVALNFPENVCVALNNLKSVTVIGEQKRTELFLPQQVEAYYYKI